MLELAGAMLAQINPLEEVVVKELFTFELFGRTVVFSNHMFMVTLGAVILMILLPLALRGKGLVRRGFGGLIEATCIFIREDIARPFLGDRTDKHVGFLWTLFFFILTLNLLGMVPLAQIIYLITGTPNHLGGAATANIWVVGSLALMAFFSIHIAGIREQGLAGYLKNFIPHVPWPMAPFIYLMEIIGALVKPVSLTIRLFANIFAGHILVATLFLFIVIFKNYAVSGLTVAAVVAASLLELLVAFLQAYIFTFLSAIFMGLAIHPEH
ncbi:MAG TPA: F0F1 ATP synthase subunit A [Anaerohalosphaeraceae bacterium]|jgi:F-type H+-transporting ATPase subunit a|nr:F0F1 ATP synthase subunit A [Anaerohalosphaeraceae bacterium]HRT50131.1 F0F1 ATP synthase subunit A [Anaerohalosphaeraceae bacterium]HRT86065.1 F0F1 ATP synthase subunit A [Anaerohalosphaeraceae bacterium]